MNHYVATLIDPTTVPAIQTVVFESALACPIALLASARERMNLPDAHVLLLQISGPVEAGWVVRMSDPVENGQVLLIPTLPPMSAADARFERLIAG